MLQIVIHVLHLNLLKIRVVGCCLLKKKRITRAFVFFLKHADFIWG